MAGILPPNATPMMRAVDAAAGERAAGVDIPAPGHRDPRTCPADALPLLAREFAVIVWNDEWPLAARRMVVRNAVENNRRRGTVAAIRQVLCAFGALFGITENLGMFTGTIRIRNAASIYGSLAELKAAVGEISRGAVHWTYEEGEAVNAPVEVVTAGKALSVCDTVFRLEAA